MLRATEIEKMNASNEQILETNEDEEILLIHIESIANPLYFKGCQIAKFKQELSNCLKAVVKLSSSNLSSKNHEEDNNSDIILHYDHEIIQRCLFPTATNFNVVTSLKNDTLKRGIQWEALCKSHEDCCRRRNNYGQKLPSTYVYQLTALETVIELITNPTVIPFCCTPTIIVGLLSACVQVFTSPTFHIHCPSHCDIKKHTETQTIQYKECLTLIQTKICNLIQERPSVIISEHILKYISMWILTSHFDNDKPKGDISEKDMRKLYKKTVADYDISTGIAILIYVKEIIIYTNSKKYVTSRHSPFAKTRTYGKISPRAILHPILSLIQIVDDIDVFLLQNSSKKKGKMRKQALCAQCESSHMNRKKKPSATSAHLLAALHDEMSDIEVENYTLDLRRKMKRAYCKDIWNENKRSLSRKEVMLASVTDEDNHNISRRETCYICYVKRKRAHGEISTLPLHMIQFRIFLYRSLIELTSYFSTNSCMDSYQCVQRMVCSRPYSSSLRFSAVIIAHHICKEKDY